eukprot:TRINITY_DN2500_c0_g1_i1.p1 TRINITY_DN2500_c0_g1~~TRINITY_DN2500_c0_g1_i1.p1  ORF type:complete len:235 (+),score=79.63 TRINITY_DN2500_c0_g1_i1:497-1201(+)
MDELLQSKEIELIEYTTKLENAKKQEPEEVEKYAENEMAQKLFVLQKDNAELIQSKIELLANYNNLLMKYNKLKESSRASESSMLELKRSLRSQAPGKSTIKTPRETQPVLEKVKKLLNAKNYDEVPLAVEKLLKIFSAIPQMESFIKKICKLVLMAEEAEPEQIHTVIPKLEKWRENIVALTEDLAFYRSLTEDLQKMCGEPDPQKLFAAIEGPYFLAWKIRPFISVLLSIAK